MKTPVLQPGNIVICRASQGYALTMGKQYTVLSYEPEFFDRDTPAGFTWPAYVEVTDDDGRRVHCHAHRFVLKELFDETTQELGT